MQNLLRLATLEQKSALDNVALKFNDVDAFINHISKKEIVKNGLKDKIDDESNQVNDPIRDSERNVDEIDEQNIRREPGNSKPENTRLIKDPRFSSRYTPGEHGWPMQKPILSTASARPIDFSIDLIRKEMQRDASDMLIDVILRDQKVLRGEC